MTPLPVYIVPRRQIEELTSSPPIPRADLDNYLSVRPGILDDGHCDIFQPNCRSETQAYTRFDLFRIVDHVESGTTVVLPFWLELFENHNRSHIATCLDWMKATYPSNPCIIQWNHDRDAATVPELQDLPPNFRVLQFNTSRPTQNDIVLPFWNVETRQQWRPEDDRQVTGSFIGYVGGVKVRQAVRDAFRGKTGWVIVDTTEKALPQDEYLKWMLASDFALCPRGGGLNSYRFFESLQCGCIPILFADDVAMPYPNLDWPSISIHIAEAMADRFDYVTALIEDFDVNAYRHRIAEVRQLFQLGGIQEFVARQIRDYLE